MIDLCDVIELEVVLNEPEIELELDFEGEYISGSDGQDYKRGYDEGRAQGLIDGQADGYKNGYDEGHRVGYSSGYDTGKTEGLTEGYDNGYSKGKADGYQAGYDEGYSKGYSEGYEKGKVDGKGIDLMSYAAQVTFSNAISEVTDDIYLDLQNATYFSFRYIGISAEKITIKLTDKCTNMSNVFRSGNIDNLKEIEFVNDMGWVTNWFGAFSQRKVLERITSEIDLSSMTTNSEMFSGCYALQQFTPKPNTIKISISFSSSPNLTDESIQAIVDGLADLTGQESQTLTVHKDVFNRMSNEQKAFVTSKNWTLASSK